METLGLWNALESFARGCRSETGPIVDRGMQCEQRFGASRGVLLLCWLWGKLLAKLMFKDTSDLSRAIAVIGRLSVCNVEVASHSQIVLLDKPVKYNILQYFFKRILYFFMFT